MSQPVPAPRSSWLVASCSVGLCVALAIALDHGIQVGRENHAGLLPVVRRILDPGYLPGDFGIFLRAHHHRVFALVVAALSAGLGENGALALLTVLGYAALFAGLWSLGAAVGLAWERRLLLGVALATGALFLDHGVEANRMLGNGPIMPPTFAHAFVLLSLAQAVRGRWNAALAWAGAVALIHLQIGAVWLLVLAGVMAQARVWGRPRAWLPGGIALVLVSSPALWDLAALLRQGLTRQMAATGDIALRMPQHFQFHGNRVAVVALYLGLLWWLVRRWRARGDVRAQRFAPVAWAALVMMALTALHYVDYYVLGSGWISRLQLLRLSMFVPVLAAAALLAAVPAPAPDRTRRQRGVMLGVAALFAVLAVGNLYRQGEPPSLRVVDAAQGPGAWPQLCRWVRASGPRGLYVTPPGQTGFTAMADRSTLVEFKINPDGGAGRQEWQRRLLALTGGVLPPRSSRTQAAAALDALYAQLDAAGLAALQRDYGVRYAVLPAASRVQGPVLYRNDEYRVIALPPGPSP